MEFILNLFLIVLGIGIGFGAVFFSKDALLKLTSRNVSTPIENVANVVTKTINSSFSVDKPPSQSLVGQITTLSGDVSWQGRIATEASQIKSPIKIQQGESLATDVDGKVELQFENSADIELNQNSAIDVVQTLPLDIVIQQTKGSVEYKKLGTIPVSVRILHLLIEDNGDTLVSLDPKRPVISVKVISGSLTVAYNNLNNVSKFLTVQKGKTLTFNDQNRRVVLK